MEITTSQAFAEMINLRAIHRELELNSSTTRTWRQMVNKYPEDPSMWKISIGRMEELLEKFGYTVVQEKLWKKQRRY